MKLNVTLNEKTYEVNIAGEFITYFPQMPSIGGLDEEPSYERKKLALEGLVKLGVGYYGEKFLTDKKLQKEFLENQIRKIMYLTANIGSVEKTTNTNPPQPGNEEN